MNMKEKSTMWSTDCFDNIKTEKDMPLLGSRVTPGPDWMWDDQSAGGAGTVINHATNERISFHVYEVHKIRYPLTSLQHMLSVLLMNMFLFYFYFFVLTSLLHTALMNKQL